ncbi:hypothetical protein SASPL_106480 [Salvia splendens]|uniref:Pentatricopeptide repeat domain-containing protein 1 n=1 Tax=Salvia splendens TaxID=180675 RepID=A0A8X8YRE8_SALSN|nr:hypothetical protein SASPL_106480 [Salvia splendens]
MFSSSSTITLPCVFLRQNQPTCTVDAHTLNIANGKRQYWKVKGCSSISSIGDLNFSISEDLDGDSNVKLDDTNPSNRHINSITIGRWVQSCSNVREVKKLHGVVSRRMRDPLAYVNNNLISMYARFGELVAARRRYGLGDEALRLFLEFVNSGLYGNAQTYVCVLNLCGRTFNYELGRQLHASAVKNQMLSEGLDLNEFTVCSEEKELRFGEQLHATVVKRAYDILMFMRNAITWNSIIAGYARNNLGDDAIRLFRIMKRLRVPTDNSTMVSILRACGLLKALSTGKEVHAQIFKNFEPSNIFIGSALVWLYCKCGDYASASKVLQNLPDKDVVSWTAMISGCTRLGHEHEALEYLQEMLGEGVEPNPFTYSSVLKACANLESVRQGELIHSSLTKTPSLSNVFVGSALVHMYSKCGHLSEAAQVFDSMP